MCFKFKLLIKINRDVKKMVSTGADPQLENCRSAFFARPLIKTEEVGLEIYNLKHLKHKYKI